jgi:hypothetical protein
MLMSATCQHKYVVNNTNESNQVAICLGCIALASLTVLAQNAEKFPRDTVLLISKVNATPVL